MVRVFRSLRDMATGLLIRDFFKEYRELRYSDSGSILTSEIEHNAYRLSLTLEITHIDAPRYGSLKTLPENTHYGYVTLFRGSTVTDTIAIKYPKFRVFDIRNQGIWNYHQSTESLQLNAGVSVVASNASSSGILGKLGDLVTGTICFLVGIEALDDPNNVAAEYILDFFDCSEPDGGTRDITKRYRGFPIATPFPDIAKFKADVPCSFLWRLESWYLVNPAVYIVDSPTDTSDETDGEDEYPVPEQGDGDGDGDEFPESSPIPEDADNRDFDESNIPPLPPPFEGGQCEGVAYSAFGVLTAFNGTECFRFGEAFLGTVIGPVRGFSSTVVPPDTPEQAPRRLWVLRHNGPDINLGVVSLFNCPNAGYSDLRLQRNDGLPDNCGNPLPGG